MKIPLKVNMFGALYKIYSWGWNVEGTKDNPNYTDEEEGKDKVTRLPPEKDFSSNKIMHFNFRPCPKLYMEA